MVARNIHAQIHRNSLVAIVARANVDILIKLMLYQTPIGPHDGDSWERLCQVCLKTKYSGQYIEVPASPGDFGLDGFTTMGDAYQCYCPERECSDEDLYESQRDKITKDIKKLRDYKDKIEPLLNGIPIKRWYLLTPKIRTNDLITHCNSKIALVKSWSLPFIDNDFRVIPLNYEYLAEQIPVALSMIGYTAKPGDIERRLDFRGQVVSESEIENYKNNIINNVHTTNAFLKHTARYRNKGDGNFDARVVEQVDRTVRNLLIGDSILKEWETMFQDQLDKFIHVMGVLEREVSDLCDVPTNDSEARYKEIQLLIQSTIDSEFRNLSLTTRKNLAMRVLADWILRCPLKFE
jgi:hypothetical protein